MIKLRPYQLEAVNKIKDTFTKEFRQYIEMPTGSGKTVTFLYYSFKYHSRILIIVPSKQIFDQVYSSALLFWNKEEISRKGNNFNESFKKVHICIINSIKGDYLEKLSKEKFDLTVIDEAHHTQSNSYKRFIKYRSKSFHEKDMLILGVTATPDRLDGALLDEILYTKSFTLSIETLISQKHLSDIEGFSVKTNIDLSEIYDHNHDFSVSSLYDKLSNDQRNNLIIYLYKNNLSERKTLIFCINIKHSLEICSLFKQSGISCAHIDGTMNMIERQSILSSFRNGEISVICNSNLLIEGFDEPSINGIILARPTKSKAFFLQMIGRGLRIFPGKINCKIIDIVDNHKKACRINNIITDLDIKLCESFNSLSDIKEYLNDKMIELSEITLSRINIFNSKKIHDYQALDCMVEYLEKNNVYFHHPLSFDEGSFLIWFDKLKKEFKNGVYS